MIVMLTKSALNKLKEIELEKEQAPRIDASIAGGCEVSVKFTLIFDEPRRGDIVMEDSGIQIRLDRFTKRYLEEVTHIDYTDEHVNMVFSLESISLQAPAPLKSIK
ncbi:iron-sulfur cluster biosynthesis family protein [Bacillus thermotolerans]|uniref:iron-sulfur cluster biosynthesis family protein n=1 Tax=Bacillus thermotolerans TaxID=1221996 RepID=UPI000591A727|nr:iron-sulfur cluster biosynthesis family protein [Bacillus thermotolerans]KKB44819.1 hypothetical protein QY96_01100 [Bacillus thermotolerans]